MKTTRGKSGNNHVATEKKTSADFVLPHVQPDAKNVCTDVNLQEVALTHRELEVMRGIAETRRNSEIAQELFISTRTVEKHVENILRKMGVKRRTLAVQHFQVSTERTEKSKEAAA